MTVARRPVVSEVSKGVQFGRPSAGAPPGKTPGRIGRDPIAPRLDHMPPKRSAGVFFGSTTASFMWRE